MTQRKSPTPVSSRSGLQTLLPDRTLPRGYLSKSSIEMFLRCPKQFEFRYVRNIVAAPGVALVEGSAMGNALNLTNENFIAKGRYLRPSVVVEKFHDEFEAGAKTLDKYAWSASETRSKDVHARGEEVLLEYLGKYAPRFSPTSVERRVEIMFGGVPVLGYTDMEEASAIWDYKRVKQAYNQPKADADLQFSLYAAESAKKRKGGFICLVKSGNRVEITETSRTMADLKAADALVAGVADSIRKGTSNMCNPAEWNCSRKWCGYWSQCRGKLLKG